MELEEAGARLDAHKAGEHEIVERAVEVVGAARAEVVLAILQAQAARLRPWCDPMELASRDPWR